MQRQILRAFIRYVHCFKCENMLTLLGGGFSFSSCDIFEEIVYQGRDGGCGFLGHKYCEVADISARHPMWNHF